MSVGFWKKNLYLLGPEGPPPPASLPRRGSWNVTGAQTGELKVALLLGVPVSGRVGRPSRPTQKRLCTQCPGWDGAELRRV